MITRKTALGMEVDVLTWDGNEEELRSFTPDEIFGVDENGVATLGTRGTGVNRWLRPGDLLIRPAGRTDISPLHFFQGSWWTRNLGLL